MSDLLRLTSIRRTFDQTSVLSDVSFTVGPGDRLAVLGPSGSGKTTLLRLIAGLEAPTEGQIHIEGKLASRAGEVSVAPEHRGVALVFQGLALFPHLRALDQIAFAARGRRGIDDARLLLERIGLPDRANARLDELSGGERQRIALARALAQQPKLLLMDEPFASLDDEKRGQMRDLLRSLLHNTPTALILVTHSRDDALNLASKALILDRGKQSACDTLQNVMERPQTVAAARSLGLGQILEGIADAPGEAVTPFGRVRLNTAAKSRNVRLLVRPDQPKIVSEGGVEAEVLSLELRPPELRQARWIAVVGLATHRLRISVGNAQLPPGDRVRVWIDGECEVLD